MTATNRAVKMDNGLCIACLAFLLRPNSPDGLPAAQRNVRCNRLLGVHHLRALPAIDSRQILTKLFRASGKIRSFHAEKPMSD
jgi:hypothetical protein